MNRPSNLSKSNLINRPLFWGIIYIASIFLFAAIYSLLDKAFVQSTYEHEQNTKDFLTSIAEEFSGEYISGCESELFSCSGSRHIYIRCATEDGQSIRLDFTASSYREGFLVVRDKHLGSNPYKNDLANEYVDRMAEITGITGLLGLRQKTDTEEFSEECPSMSPYFDGIRTFGNAYYIKNKAIH